ncbi:hypothetical protein B0H11DRAFT_1902514 [Mycena galericulata]|nr:hypothetical protein B0H11DRAFT_1902514 [Mycena galericulata]
MSAPTPITYTDLLSVKRRAELEVNRLDTLRSGIPGPSCPAAASTSPPLPAPPSIDARLARMERLLVDLLAVTETWKRARSPSPARDMRAVRARLDNGAASIPTYGELVFFAHIPLVT